MAECNDKAWNIESYCGPCTKAKRALGQSVVNKGSPQNEAKSVALKKRKHDRSAYEQGLCDRYALQCMSQCIQCLSQCICLSLRRADTRICECTRPVILCVHISAENCNTIHKKAGKETRRKSKAGEPLTNHESKHMIGYSYPFDIMETGAEEAPLCRHLLMMPSGTMSPPPPPPSVTNPVLRVPYYQYQNMRERRGEGGGEGRKK